MSSVTDSSIFSDDNNMVLKSKITRVNTKFGKNQTLSQILDSLINQNTVIAIDGNTFEELIR